MKIGELGKIVGLRVETIRYYERLGLLNPPSRTDSGYRNYTTDASRRLQFIKQAQELGFSLTEIKGLVDYKDNKGSELDKPVRQKILTLDSKIEELSRFKDYLIGLISAERDLNAA